MNNELQPSPELIDIIKKFEGRKPDVYIDADGGNLPTGGFGHTKGLTHADVGTPVSDEQAEAWLSEDVTDAVNEVKNLVTVALTQGQFDALVEFVFNLGDGQLEASTLLELLNHGKYSEIPAQLALWNKVHVNGVLTVSDWQTERRAADIALWNSIAA